MNLPRVQLLAVVVTVLTQSLVQSGNVSVSLPCTFKRLETEAERGAKSAYTSDCGSAIDLVFIVDASSKSSSTGWQSMLSFVNSVIDRFTISQSSVRVAFVRYAVDADVRFFLGWFCDRDALALLVSSTSLIGGPTSNLGRALDLARVNVFSSCRPGASKVAVVVTDRLPYSDQVRAAINNVKSSGVRVIMVGVGQPGLVDPCFLFQLASDNQLFLADDYESLNDAVSRIVYFVCSDEHPSSTTAAATTTTTTTTTTPRTTRPTLDPRYCSVTNIELVFVVDSSSKSDSSAWSSMLTFVNSVINKFNVAQNAVRVAFVRYSNQPTVVFNLNSYSDRYYIQAAVNSVPYTGGSSDIAPALDVVRTQVLSSSNVRSNALKILITVTDQLYATSVNGLTTAINNCRSAGIRMYGVGIMSISGRSVDSDALYQLSYNSDQSNPWQATWVYGYNDLPNRVTPLTRYACVGGIVP